MRKLLFVTKGKKPTKNHVFQQFTNSSSDVAVTSSSGNASHQQNTVLLMINIHLLYTMKQGIFLHLDLSKSCFSFGQFLFETFVFFNKLKQLG